MLDMSDVTITCTKVSPRKLEANRANAKKSTGPRTPRGKRRSSLNALQLGIFSAGEGLIFGESEPEYNFHRIEMLRSLNPSNHLQLRYAGLIIAASWNINRISWAERQEHWWTVDLQFEQHEKTCAKQRRRRDYEGLPEEKDPRFKSPTEWVQTLLLLGGEGSPATRFERLQKYKMQLEMSMNRNQNQFRKLKKDAGDEPSKGETELTKATIARWAKECEPCDPDAEDEATPTKAKTEKPEASKPVEQAEASAQTPSESKATEKSKTNPPISETLAVEEVSEAGLEHLRSDCKRAQGCPGDSGGAAGCDLRVNSVAVKMLTELRNLVAQTTQLLRFPGPIT